MKNEQSDKMQKEG